MAVMWQTPDVGEQVMEAMTSEAIQVALAPEMGEARAVEAGSHIDATMKDCILKLYRSAVNVGAEWHDDVDAITTPTLVLWGRQDAYVPPEIGERIAQRTHARLVMFETRPLVARHLRRRSRPRTRIPLVERLRSPMRR